MAVSTERRETVASNPPPSAEKVRAAASEYMARAGMMPTDLAAEINYSTIALRHFFFGTYSRLAGTDLYLRNASFDFSYRRLRYLARNVEKLRALPGNESASLRGLIAAAASKMMEAM